ncbi:PREDICTED: luc7-like protein 3 isoform X3 [Wasmannia auropunctata]|uniref:luc7-like protein 3 isoform X3 n=1 Tax=Wasmannia auropunctata TaxID=64793 RepID=UPI0005EEA0B8|nr:PREDICTED: luc7-like protein 3 isoform X3 [Wasmannia auropunctata]
MAAAAAAALLDELMGRNRNVLPNEKPKELNWEDPEFCKLYLVKFCPHDLFVNTRADLGVCPKVHDDEARELFEKAPHSYRKQQYEDEFIRYCQSMLNEVERKIIKGKQRLALIGRTEAPTLTPAQTQRNEEQIALLTEKINKLVEEAEQSGIQGNVEQAQGLMRLCDQLKEERETLRKSNDNSHYNQTAELAAAQEKQMEVCDVCGAFLIVGDAQQRIDDHLMGKQHVGYARLKSALQEIMNKREKARDEKEQRREEERKQRARANEELDRRRRDGDRDRDRDRERDKRRRRMDDDKSRHDSGGHSRNAMFKNWSQSNGDVAYYRNSGHRSRSRSRDKHHREEDSHRRHGRDKGNRDHRSSSHHSRRRHRSRSRSHK